MTLLLTLTACTPKQNKDSFSPTLVDSLLESGAFSEPLEVLDEEIAWMLYGLEDAGIVPDKLTDLRACRSSGATCEEAAVFLFSDEAAAQTAIQALELYITDQIQVNKDYRPADIPKLEQAVLECRGTSVLLLVAADYDAANPSLNS